MRTKKKWLSKKKWLCSLFTVTFLSFMLLLYSICCFSFTEPEPSTVRFGLHSPPAFAYYICGEHGDGDRILRLLLAIYHPRNRYLLHLGAEASDYERLRLIADVNTVPAIRAFGNVDVVGKANRLVDMGSSYLAALLRVAAILLRIDDGWNWFVSLSASDYPLLTQDDLSYVFSSVSRNLNFIDHTGNLGWKVSQRVKPIVVDPGIYLARRSKIFYATQKRPIPESFKLFTGSPWFILSRQFLEYCILGWENLPRSLLMYFNNAVLPEESYFHSVICNTPEFVNTTVNSDLRYMRWDNPPKMEPHFLDSSNYDQMVRSGAAFARQFNKDNYVLDMVDEKILKRRRNRVTPGAWCSGQSSWWNDPCSKWNNVNVVKPGQQAKKFDRTIAKLVEQWKSQINQCQ